MVSRRGGYCFEQNGLFGAVLAEVGFAVRPLLARVWFGGVTEPREKTHQLLLVELGGRPWIADVGFGTAGPALPMPMEAGRISAQPGRRYRLAHDETFGFMMERSVADGPWEKLYSFNLERCWQADFEMGNFYVSKSPHSPFTSRSVCSRQTPDGWIVLVNHDLIEVKDGQTLRHVVEPGPAYMDMLRERFDLDLGVPYEALGLPPAADAA
ncbi:arylamine N-acetyltransferase [Sphingosinicellaceae bacterium A1X5R2]|nr:arylamine N-acetyltransferase [Pedomonas mirosovicensis]MCH8685322.1 arylamine N-acetyltransferase [Pedomonas mirosovicensis]